VSGAKILRDKHEHAVSQLQAALRDLGNALRDADKAAKVAHMAQAQLDALSPFLDEAPLNDI
jgi:pyrroloquinoline quinone (PQQ) biosynthesis protein C